jgi:hypothetical protein
MPVFELCIYQTWSGSVRVEADSVEQAIDKFCEDEVDYDLQPLKGLEISGEEAPQDTL